MALPKGAAADLAKDMASQGMGEGPSDDASDPSMPDSDEPSGDVYEDIAKDIIANQSDPKELANFLKEFVERCISDKGGSYSGGGSSEAA